MGTEVLRPQNCLGDGIRDPPAIIQRRRNTGSRKPPVRANHHRRRFSSGEFTKSFMAPEKVRILRRGQSFDSISKSFSQESFAGSSTLVVSPAPSSLPLPSFSRKEKNQVVLLQVDDSASRDLRRLLRLEF